MADNNFFGVKKGLRFKPSTLPVSGNLGEITYDTATSSFKQWSGTSWVAITGSGSGAKNFITGGDAESGTTGWVTYADAAATRPVDGTGGSPNVTFTTTSTSPLINLNSFLFTKDAANRQGQGASYDFTIDAAYKAKVLQISIDYVVNSGTFVAGTNTTDSDLIVYLYDVTNSQLIEPSSIKFLSNNSILSDKFSSTFQTSATGTQYRLILHCASTSASAYTLKLDDISVSPSTYVYGTPITDWIPWTPTGSWTSNTVYTGKKRRIGDSMEYVIQAATSGAPTATNFTADILEVMDTSKMVSANHLEPIGFFRTNDSGGTQYHGTVRIATTTSVSLAVFGSAGTYVNDPSLVTDTIPFTYGSADFITLEFKVPIVGLSSSVQMSNQTDTRIASMKAKKETTLSLTTGSWTIITGWDAAEVDTHGGFNNTTGVYTVQVPGYYKVVGQITYATNSTGTRNIQINRNSESLATPRIATASTPGVGPNECTANASSTDFYNTGDTIRIYGLQTSGGNLGTSTSGGYNGFSIERLTGPSAIAATESVNARYSTGAGQSIANAATPIVDFGTKVFDSHGAVTTGASWKFTAPISGVYEISSRIRYANSTAWAANSFMSSQVFKNNVIYCVLSDFVVQTAFTNVFAAPSVNGTTSIKLLAGEFIDIRTAHNESTARALLSSDLHIFVDIARIGN